MALAACKLVLPNCEFEEFTYKKMNRLEFAEQNAATDAAAGFAESATTKPTNKNTNKNKLVSETELLDPAQMTHGTMYYYFRVNLTWTDTPSNSSTRKKFFTEGSYNKLRKT